MTTPRFSLVIPAYNEAAWLPALLDTVDTARAQYRGGAEAIEVIVANNASTDETATIAKARGCRVTNVEKRMIAAARNGGAALALGEIICFIDADSRIHADTFNAIDAVLAKGNFIVGATGVRPERWSLGIFVTWIIAIPFVFLMKMDAGVVFCRRTDFESVGGYDETLYYAEDVKLMVDLKRLGRARGQRFKRPKGVLVITSSRKFDKHGEWHFLLMIPRIGFWMLFDKSRGDQRLRRLPYASKAWLLQRRPQARPAQPQPTRPHR